jgi:class 3 adenylate cyclase
VNANTPVGTVTMLFTDIEGSTALLRSLGDRYGELVRDHHNLLRAVTATHGGQVVDTQGDAFFFAFPTAKEALLAGIEAQRKLSEHVWPDGVDLRVRMGMHTGEPALGSEGYLGIDVVNAARICAAAHGGQLLVSETTRALVRSDPPDGIGFRDLGEHNLKGLGHSQRLFQVEMAGLPDRFPPLRTGAPEPAAVAGMEKRADALADRINAAVLSHVESRLQRALAAETGTAGPEASAAAEGDDPMPAASEIMKLSVVGLATLLLLVIVVVVSIWLVKSVL